MDTTAMHALASALDEVAGVFGDLDTAANTGKFFTCRESDAIARLLLAAGHPLEAANWLTGHAGGDDVDDEHYDEEADRPMTYAEIRGYLEAMT